MSKILDYVVITSSKGVENLEGLIKENIRLGWQPLGGVTTISSSAVEADVSVIKVSFAQSMVKYDD